METLLEIKNLSVKFTTEKNICYALNGVNLTLNKGESLGLVGESGAGKTTTALATLNLLPPKISQVTSGEIYYNGQNVFEMSKEELQAIRGKKSQ